MPETVETTQTAARRKPNLSEAVFRDRPNVVAAESIVDSCEAAPLEGLLRGRRGKAKLQKVQ